MKSALSFGLRDYSVSAYAPSALIEEISRDLSPWSFVFTERLIVLLLRQPRASPSVFFPMDHPSQYRVVMFGIWKYEAFDKNGTIIATSFESNREPA